ncbi:MAG: alpha/beta fold hydrolase [Chloroflexi bacterium]|nr:alpha/beta fold hydrolase [Chloroflexota bacterium]
MKRIKAFPTSFLLILVLSLALLTGCKAERQAELPIADGIEIINCGDLLPIPDIAEYIFPSENIICGYVPVPENHDDPNSAEIKIAVYIIPSTSNAPAADPVVYLAGGPGGSAVSLVNEFMVGESAFLRDKRDIVMIDQRGTGYSQPGLFCPEMELGKMEMQEAVQTCRDRFTSEGVNLAHYNSHQNALDVDLVRQTLGYKEWNLYGSSYGTRLALTIMRDAPEGVRSVVLASVFPPQINGMSEAPWINYWMLDSIVSICDADADCQAAFPDLAADIEASILRLAENPIGDLGAQDYLALLGERFGQPKTPQIISLIAHGEEEEILDMLANMGGGEEDEELTEELMAILQPVLSESFGMGYAVVCAEEYPFLEEKALPDNSGDWSNAVKEIIGETPEPYTSALCPTWDVPAAEELEIQPVESDIPTLILAGDVDIATPPAWSILAGETLSLSQYVEFPQLGHGVLGLHKCVSDVVAQFVDAPTAAVDSGCVSDMPVIAYQASEE